MRRYQLHLTASGVGVPTINQTISTLRPDLVERATFVPAPRKLPVVLSPEEVARLLDAAPSLKYRAALSVAVALKVSDIDSKPAMKGVDGRDGPGHDELRGFRGGHRDRVLA
ncbi:hypothetical protein [Bradyrhizobium sp.]|uniref:hypothetical protein n=1 Tax=Bradyrhizobium sp. TaxID=376 RepID=UPI003C3B5512